MTLFGGVGLGAGTLADTWVLDDDQWTPVFPNHSPPQRRLGQMVYDELHQRLVLFAGRDPNGALDDTWIFDGSIPSRRYSSPMAGDGAIHRSTSAKTVLA